VRLDGGISLIVPLQNEARSVEDLIRSINHQSLPPDEIVLVDAGCTDDTIALASAMQTSAPLRVQRAGRVHPGIARNVGASASTQRWLAFTDGGIVLDHRWLAALAAAVREDTAVVYGNYAPVCDSLFKQCAALAYVSARSPEGTRGPSVASCLVRRDAFEVIGGFPGFRAAEDLIFIDALEARGFSRVFAPAAIAHWQIAGTVRATYARLAAYSYHNLIAGWGRHWHLGVVRLYALLALAVAAAVPLSLGWWTCLLVPGFFVVRASKAAWVKRRSFEFRTLSLRHILGTAVLLTVVDAATIAGSYSWARLRLVRAPR
jgi:glycosyltransferase involved in cell wall biosynthesis